MIGWRADLSACGRAPTRRQALVAWIANPGFALACHYRVAAWMIGRGTLGRMLALLIERRMIAVFGCHLSASATIGAGVRFPHPVGIVIGEGVAIGAGATIFQHVTLGRQRADRAEYPSVGSRAVIYCGAMVLGGVTIGDGEVIGAGRKVVADGGRPMFG